MADKTKREQQKTEGKLESEWDGKYALKKARRATATVEVQRMIRELLKRRPAFVGSGEAGSNDNDIGSTSRATMISTFVIAVSRQSRTRGYLVRIPALSQLVMQQ
jgi:hypothetical protein